MVFYEWMTILKIVNQFGAKNENFIPYYSLRVCSSMRPKPVQ